MKLLLYVDDLFLRGEHELIKYARRILATEFEMKYLGMMHYFLGMEVWQNASEIFLGQGKYAIDILKKFEIIECKAITTPMASKLKLLCDASSESINATMYHQMIGSLICPTNMRPDICFVVNTLSQFLTYTRHVHLVTAKHVLGYLKGTVDHGLKYDTNQKINLHVYVDSD